MYDYIECEAENTFSSLVQPALLEGDASIVRLRSFSRVVVLVIGVVELPTIYRLSW